MAGVYLSAYMTSELGVVTDIPVPVAQYAGVTQDGRPVSEPLGLAGIAMKLAVIAGATSAGVSAAGLARVVRVARTETMSAARTAQRDFMAEDDRVNGYYRQASGHPCAACMGIAGTQFRDDEVFPIHGACQCTAEPLLVGLPDNHRPQDGKAIIDDMGPDRANAAYGDRVGALNDGTASLSDMATIRDANQWGAGLFESPVASITG